MNGYGQPVFTGGMYKPDEALILERAVKDYCSSKNVSISDLIDTGHNKAVRGAWKDISQSLPHRTVLSVYRRAKRQFHGMTRGTWSKEEVASLFNLVDLHGHRWKIIQDKLGRSSVDCRVKYFDLNDGFDRGEWTKENIELLLQKVRSALNLPRDNMDVREINKWTLENDTKIPWTSISPQVNRRRQDCYSKWRQMTKRSNKKAIELGLETVPMNREYYKCDVRSEYYQWKKDPHSQEADNEDNVLSPFFENEGCVIDDQREKDMQLVDYIIESKATRLSQISFSQKGEDAKERWEELVDIHATDDDMDLPMWKLAKVVKANIATASSSSEDVPAEQASNQKMKSGKKRKRKSNDSTKSSSERHGSAMSDIISGVPILQLQQSVQDIVGTANQDDITVKGVRKQLEKRYKIDLSSHKKLIKRMVIDAV